MTAAAAERYAELILDDDYPRETLCCRICRTLVAVTMFHTMSDTELTRLLDEIEAFASVVYVRDDFEGHWKSYALTELPVRRALYHAFGFIRQRIEHPEQAMRKEDDL